MLFKSEADIINAVCVEIEFVDEKGDPVKVTVG